MALYRLRDSHLNLEDGDGIFLRNVGTNLKIQIIIINNRIALRTSHPPFPAVLRTLNGMTERVAYMGEIRNANKLVNGILN